MTLASADLDSAALSAASRSYLRRRLLYVFLLTLGGIAATVGAAILIVDHQDSGPALFAVQITGLLGGPTAVGAALVWLFALSRRLRGVRLREWTSYPARSASLGFGPVRLTVVGFEMKSMGTFVIFPELWFRARIRRLVAREGQILVLEPRRGKTFDHVWYAGASGQPVFSDQPPLSHRAQSFWERKAVAALNRENPP
jgi:hypothetical protein